MKNLDKMATPMYLLEKPEFHMKLKPTDLVEVVKLNEGEKVCFGAALDAETKNDMIRVLKDMIAIFA